MDSDLFADLSDGYRKLHHSARITSMSFEQAVAELLSWRVHERAGLGVEASEVPLALGTTVRLRLGWRLFGVTAPCRVIEVLDEPDRQGFTYETLPGHPESGVEQFMVTRDPDGQVWFHIEARSKPSAWYARVGRPLTGVVQSRITRRYLSALT